MAKNIFPSSPLDHLKLFVGTFSWSATVGRAFYVLEGRYNADQFINFNRT
jgi:hypothetical protein